MKKYEMVIVWQWLGWQGLNGEMELNRKMDMARQEEEY